ncbi:MAG: VWA domain-containing protein [Actinobacteria bacterium]|nr:VWA domain-containing protein [Actinomycetota bacterium]MCL5446818.1 VWA domain-containing protein [Actinomycetota bacterium]
MLELLTEFVEELREAGLPVSLTESIDAANALHQIHLEDRDALERALGATMCKSQAHWKVFKSVFEIFFAVRSVDPAAGAEAEAATGERVVRDHAISDMPHGGLTGYTRAGHLSASDLAQAALEVLLSGDDARIAMVAAYAVSRFAGMEPGRPVGGTYYLYRTLRALDFDNLVAKLMEIERASAPQGTLSSLEERLARDEHRVHIEKLRTAIKDEIRRRLVEDRGAKALARSVRKPLLEDVDVMHATREELDGMRKAIRPLSRKLAVRLAKRDRHLHRGSLDFRATVRQSLSTGGVPLQPRFRSPKPSKPEIVVLADISGSVATFARFTLELVHAVGSQLKGVRSFVFVDGIDEVTHLIEGQEDIAQAVRRVSTEANVMWVDGHSDYGHAFTVFLERWGGCVGPKTTLLILGDARNNYHSSQAWVMAELHRRARSIFWLDPEPRAYWGTGDSVVEEYGNYCDAVVECRSLRQLEDFVSELAGNGRLRSLSPAGAGSR